MSWTWPVLLMTTASACITANARVELAHHVSRVERIDPTQLAASEPTSIPADHIELVMRDGTRHLGGRGTVNVVDDLIMLDRGPGTNVSFTAERATVASLELSQTLLRGDAIGLDANPSAVTRAKERAEVPEALGSEHTSGAGGVIVGVVLGVLLLGALAVASCSSGCIGPR